MDEKEENRVGLTDILLMGTGKAIYITNNPRVMAEHPHGRHTLESSYELVA